MCTQSINSTFNQIKNELQRNELATNRALIIKAAKLLKEVENQFTRDTTAHAKSVKTTAKQCHASSLDYHRAVVCDEWTVRNQQQLYRFHFNELTAQIHHLKRQLNVTQIELMDQMKISHDLSVN